MQGYEAKIKEASRELDVKERIALKDVSATQSIDDMSLQAKEAGARLNIVPSAWAIVEIHNEKSENTDYEVFVLIDENGQRYSTSSESFTYPLQALPPKPDYSCSSGLRSQSPYRSPGLCRSPAP